MSSLDLEIVRILVAAGVITVGQPWNEQTVKQARQFFMGIARQIQVQEQVAQVQNAPPLEPEPKKKPGPKPGSKRRAKPETPVVEPVEDNSERELEPANGNDVRADS